MNHPQPHSFSHSPIEEVFCRCIGEAGDEVVSLTIPPPYPGWPHIRNRIRDMITGNEEIFPIKGCMIRYTDLIPVSSGKNLPGTAYLADLIYERFDCSYDNSQDDTVLISTKIPNLSGSVCSIHNRPGKPGWTLVFTMNTGGPVRFVAGDGVLIWFDSARAIVHDLFDLIVPAEIVQELK
jgi:uncharacterized protein (TIGR04255 family)